MLARPKMPIRTTSIMWAEEPMMLAEDATLYNPNKGTARVGDLFVYKEMIIFCAKSEAVKRPMTSGERCYIYGDTTACFEKNGVFVICQDQYNVGVNVALRDSLKTFNVCPVKQTFAGVQL